MARQTSLRRAAYLIGGLICLSGTSLMAQGPDGRRERPEAPRPLASVPYVPAAKSVILDGEFLEEAWGDATRVTDFYQVDPVEGVPSDPPTEVWLMRDNQALYLAFICHEPEVEGMVLQNMARDAFLNEDDRIEFIFDTFRDGKNGYFFQMSAPGSRGDALVGDNGQRFNKPWNASWEGQTKILSDRWVAEIRIPFSTLRFGDNPTWRGNFQRNRSADRSRHLWSNRLRHVRMQSVSSAGDLDGFENLDQGYGLEFRPYFKGKYQDETGDSDLLGDVGGEINWSINPQLRASLTWNTDFAETEVDARRVNTSRFPLFFPEKRDFFLQDSTMFEFGELNGNNVLPFFSRRIGLAGGREVPLEAGLRVAGQAGRFGLGFLGVHTGERTDIGIPDGDLFVFRPNYQVSETFAIGSLLTSGNPLSDQSNTVAGLDMRYSSTKFYGGTFNWNNFLVWSDDDTLDAQGLGFGSEASYRTRHWQYRAGIVGTQDDFAPALGFIRRPGEVLTSGMVQWTPRPEPGGPVRFFRFTLSPSVWTDLDGNTITSRTEISAFEAELQSGDEFRIGVIMESDRPDRPFTVGDGVAVLPGAYDWILPVMRVKTSKSRQVYGQLTLLSGDWYDGNITQTRAEVNYRPNEFLNTQLNYIEDKGSVSGGDFTVRIERLSVDFSFSPEVSIETLIQADNQSDTLGLQSRLRWIVEDGRELFLVVDSGWEELASGAIVPTGSDVTVKVVYSVRI